MPGLLNPQNGRLFGGIDPDRNLTPTQVPPIAGLLGADALGPSAAQFAQAMPPPNTRLFTNGLAFIPPVGLPGRRVAPPASGQKSAAQKDPYSGADLVLGPNEDYRDAILSASRRFHVLPQIVAASVNAEANRDAHGHWDPKSVNHSSGASGLGGFLSKTWIGEAERAGSYLNGIARSQGFLGRHGHVLPARQQELLNLRFNADHAINAAADYAAFNLAHQQGLTDNSPQNLARTAYLAHHEGLAGARAFNRGTPDPRHSIPRDKRQRYLRENKGDMNRAYRAWFNDYMNDRVNVDQFTGDPTQKAAQRPAAPRAR